MFLEISDDLKALVADLSKTTLQQGHNMMSLSQSFFRSRNLLEIGGGTW